jgi:hypothetical protein
MVEVDLEETNDRQARRLAEHHVKNHMRQFGDLEKRLVQNCRFWPVIRESKPDGNFEDIIVLHKPTKQTRL